MFCTNWWILYQHVSGNRKRQWRKRKVAKIYILFSMPSSFLYISLFSRDGPLIEQTRAFLWGPRVLFFLLFPLFFLWDHEEFCYRVKREKESLVWVDDGKWFLVERTVRQKNVSKLQKKFICHNKARDKELKCMWWRSKRTRTSI